MILLSQAKFVGQRTKKLLILLHFTPQCFCLLWYTSEYYLLHDVSVYYGAPVNTMYLQMFVYYDVPDNDNLPHEVYIG